MLPISFPQTTSHCHDLFSNIATISPADVEMDTLSISGPQSTGDPRASPSISQPDLAVPDQPTSEMVEDTLEPDVHAAFDIQINESFPLLLLDLKDSLEGTILSLIKTIAGQNDHKITVGNAEDIVNKYKWLRRFLVEHWQERTFTKLRRLSECPRCTFPVLRATFFFPEILHPSSTVTSSSSTDAIMSGPGRLSSSTTEILLMHR